MYIQKLRIPLINERIKLFINCKFETQVTIKNKWFINVGGYVCAVFVTRE